MLYEYNKSFKLKILFYILAFGVWIVSNLEQLICCIFKVTYYWRSNFLSTCTAIKDGLTVHLVIRSANKVSSQSSNRWWFEFTDYCRDAVLNTTLFFQRVLLHNSRGKAIDITCEFEVK